MAWLAAEDGPALTPTQVLWQVYSSLGTAGASFFFFFWFSFCFVKIGIIVGRATDSRRLARSITADFSMSVSKSVVL